MGSHIYSEVFLHLNWHTKSNSPVLQGADEALAYGLIRQKCKSIKGVRLHGLGGTDDHVHLAARIEPSVLISDLVRELKGYSSFELNKRLGRALLHWQRGYGVVSFGQLNLPWVLRYIENQREHHADGTVNARLGAYDSDESEPDKPAEAG